MSRVAMARGDIMISLAFTRVRRSGSTHGHPRALSWLHPVDRRRHRPARRDPAHPAGLAILLVVRVLTGRSLGTFIPFAVVVAAELGNETMDWLSYGLRVGDTLSDLANTLFWPFVISLGVRVRPMALSDHPHG